MTLALSLLCENPDRLTGLTSTFKEFLVRSMVFDPDLRWIVFVGPDYRLDLENQRITVCRVFPGNNRLSPRLLADNFLVANYAKRRGAQLLLTIGFVPLVHPIPTVMHLFTLHHLSSENRVGPLRRFYRTWAARRGVRAAHLIITNSQSAATEIVRRNPEAKPKLIQSYEGLDHDRFKPDGLPGEKEALRNKVGLPQEYIVWVSNLYPYKQADLLIRAYARLPEELQTRYPIVFIGGDWDNQRSTLQALAAQLTIVDRIIFLGWIDDEWIPAALRHARLFVLPSREETFGRSVIEAMACGTPCLVNNIPIMQEVAAGAAAITNFGDTSATAVILESLLTGDQLCRQLREQGLKRCQSFDFDQLTKDRLAAIRRLFTTETQSTRRTNLKRNK
jgi:glycosyltransferase involved in cell wall biosynthesis